MEQRGDHHDPRDHHREQNEPERLSIRDRETIAGDLGAGDRLIGELTERVAGRVIGDAFCAWINAPSTGAPSGPFTVPEIFAPKQAPARNSVRLRTARNFARDPIAPSMFGPEFAS